MIQTDRLQLVPADEAHLSAQLTSRAELARAVGVAIPASWPPELYDDDAARYILQWLRDHPDQAGWGFYWIVRAPAPGAAAMLIGTCGFKGAPDGAGEVELGYGIVEECQRQGYATEAVRGLVRFAFASPEVTAVIGQTLDHMTASIGVLEKAGFRFAGAGEDPHAPPGEKVIRYELRRASIPG